MNIEFIGDVVEYGLYGLYVLSVLAILCSLFIIGDIFPRRIHKKLKQEQELDEIVASLLKDVSENYIGKHNK